MKCIEVIGPGAEDQTAEAVSRNQVTRTERCDGALHRLRRTKRPWARVLNLAPPADGHAGSAETVADAKACSMASSRDQIRPINHAASKARSPRSARAALMCD